LAAGGSINLSGGQLACAGVPDASRFCGLDILEFALAVEAERWLTNEQHERGIRHN